MVSPMLGFLQGFSYGLFLTCLPWLLVGLINPRLAVPFEPPGRLQVILRYALIVPFISMLLWLTSLWGGFGPTLTGWLAGLVAIPVALPLERRLRGWFARRRDKRRQATLAAEAARRRAQQQRDAHEANLAELDPSHPPADADDLVLALCRAKQRLIDARRPDLAVQADRVYSRYCHVLGVLGSRFDSGELAFARARELVIEVCRGVVDTLDAMASRARGVANVDGDFVRRRLSREGRQLGTQERAALVRRLELIEETEKGLRELAARNEAALTVLDDTAVSLARIETGRPQATVSTDQALEALRHFASRADRYERGRS